MYHHQRVAAVVVARANSTRLPGKMMLPFGNGTVLSTVIERLGACTLIDEIVLATTYAPEDDELERAAAELGVTVVRGSEEDVVERMMQAVDALDCVPDIVVRGCADNPLLMPTVVNEAIAELADTGSDVITPFEFATYPFGFGLTVFTTECLMRIDREARDASYREHVENFCFEHPQSFRIRYQIAPENLDYPELCATLDYLVDYERLLRCELLLAGVEIAQQPGALIERLRAGSVWIEGHTSGDSLGHDIVLRTHEVGGDSAPRGTLVVDRFSVGDEERFGLRYSKASGRGFPTEPVFVDPEPVGSEESPEAFLKRALPLALPILLAAPARPVNVQEAFVPATAKWVDSSQRHGFARALDQRYPPRIAIELADDHSGAALIEKLLNELEGNPGTELVIGEAQSAARLQDAAGARIGQDRVCSGPFEVGSPFSLLSVDASGAMKVEGVERSGDFRNESIAEYWNSRELRRARAQALNARAKERTS